MNKNIIINNKISEIGKVIEVIEALGDEKDLPLKDVFDITLSLDELLTNVISYAYDDQKSHEIEVRLLLDNDFIKIEIVDDGKPFNPLEMDDPDLNLDLDDMEIGGLGIHLVKKKMDELLYERTEHKNILTMKKIIKE